jgi:hypothetical protein
VFQAQVKVVCETYLEAPGQYFQCNTHTVCTDEMTGAQALARIAENRRGGEQKGGILLFGALIAGVASWFPPFGSCVGIRGLTSPARQGRAVHVSARMLIAVNEIDHLLQKNSTRKTPRRHGRHSRNTTSEISSRSLPVKIRP